MFTVSKNWSVLLNWKSISYMIYLWIIGWRRSIKLPQSDGSFSHVHLGGYLLPGKTWVYTGMIETRPECRLKFDEANIEGILGLYIWNGYHLVRILVWLFWIMTKSHSNCMKNASHFLDVFPTKWVRIQRSNSSEPTSRIQVWGRSKLFTLKERLVQLLFIHPFVYPNISDVAFFVKYTFIIITPQTVIGSSAHTKDNAWPTIPVNVKPSVSFRLCNFSSYT